MKIAMINGSPKVRQSNSAFMLQALEPLIHEEHEVTHFPIRQRALTDVQYIELCDMDVLVIASPLYVDGLPSHLFSMLVTLEKFMRTERNKDIYLYVMMNNGFYEGHQSQIAIEIIQNWCQRSGVTFGQGLGQGGGEMLGFLEKVPLGHGPLRNLGRAIQELAHHINTQGTGQSRFFSPNFPRFAWKWAAKRSFWEATAKKNGLKKKDMLRRL
ncbi:multimeric flavodoxin WrbA [Paenibacillus amylolyticus]|uniref:Multimeric flavodoxin WrbA n=1 Tax=Paenibacillus amylolyticus TaxID=1451 RepID=A0AAP5LQB6_PAEAM|nr:hypothetical protein [Paenibacillus amylolyticus]MDR6723319.1 multimeric flavodoxin WrbA [Paenibacillus amylolyticus]